MKRTPAQNNALHLWLSMKAEQCRNAGVSPRMAFERTIELDMTPQIMKEIFRTVQKVMLKKKSTTELEKVGEIDDIVEHLNRFFAEEFFLEGIPFPSNEEYQLLKLRYKK